MAIGNGQVATSSVRAEVIESDVDGQHVHIFNHSGDPVYLGSGDVSTSNGYKLIEEASVDLNLGPGESVSAIMAADKTGTVSYIATMNQ